MRDNKSFISKLMNFIVALEGKFIKFGLFYSLFDLVGLYLPVRLGCLNELKAEILVLG